MSLDVYLETDEMQDLGGTRIYIRENGQTREISREEWDERFPGREPVIAVESPSRDVFHYNITHNLGRMAAAAGLHDPIWYPEKVNVILAEHLVPYLQAGLGKLLNSPEHFREYNPPNGWGSYEGLITFVKAYLEACQKYPKAKIVVSR